MPPTYTPQPGDLPAQTLADWIEKRVARVGYDQVLKDFDATDDSGAKMIYRYRNGLDTSDRPAEFQPRARMEDLFDRSPFGLWDVWDEALDTTPLPEDAFCKRCHETVTPIDGTCPWCEGEVTREVPMRRYCPRCVALRRPVADGTCWQCGTATEDGPPWEPCACGCGELKRQLDPQGRPAKYVLGHSPRALERDGEMVDAEPFVRYLEARLADLDVIAALAREQGMARDDLVAVLTRRDPKVKRKMVMHALWCYGRNGKGMPGRPDSVGFFELYPDDARSKTCPGCGGGKARHADLCRSCRRKTGKTRGQQPIRIAEHLLVQAQSWIDDGASVAEVARRLFGKTPHKSVNSLRQSLKVALERRSAEGSARIAA